MHTFKNVYSSYSTSVEEPISKKLFKEICERFNMEVIEGILEGSVFNMKNNLSNLSIRRIERNPSKPTIDWWESNKYKQELLAEGKTLFSEDDPEGSKWFIYHWEKHKCKIPNKTAYRFTPTRGVKGNKEKLTKLLKEDELAYLKFKKHGNI